MSKDLISQKGLFRLGSSQWNIINNSIHKSFFSIIIQPIKLFKRKYYSININNNIIL